MIAKRTDPYIYSWILANVDNTPTLVVNPISLDVKDSIPALVRVAATARRACSSYGFARRRRGTTTACARADAASARRGRARDRSGRDRRAARRGARRSRDASPSRRSGGATARWNGSAGRREVDAVDADGARVVVERVEASLGEDQALIGRHRGSLERPWTRALPGDAARGPGNSAPACCSGLFHPGRVVPGPPAAAILVRLRWRPLPQSGLIRPGLLVDRSASARVSPSTIVLGAPAGSRRAERRSAAPGDAPARSSRYSSCSKHRVPPTFVVCASSRTARRRQSWHAAPRPPRPTRVRSRRGRAD